MALSLYIHIPFCSSKCVYCDFTSGYKPEEKLVRDYCAAVSRELEVFTGQYPGKTSLTTVYIGGGTPSLLDTECLNGLFGTIAKNCSGSRIETTLEANPGDVTPEKARNWMNNGIDRVSLGVQSMDDRILKVLGRRNTPEQNRRAMDVLRKEGFKNISVDWIAGVRGEDLKKNTREMLILGPEHFSVYQLSVEERTLLHQRVKQEQYEPLNDGESVESYWKSAEALTEAGYERYEISNFAKSAAFYSRHNLNYWDRGEYIGIGLGASGFIRDDASAGGMRWTNHTSFRDYFSALERMELPVGYLEKPDERTAMREFIMLGLRKTKGVRFSDFHRYFGRHLFSVIDQNKTLELNEFIQQDGEGLRLTRAGVNVSDRVIRLLWESMDGAAGR